MFLELLHNNKGNFYNAITNTNNDDGYGYTHDYDPQALMYVVDQLDLSNYSSNYIYSSSLDSANSSSYINSSSLNPTNLILNPNNPILNPNPNPSPLNNYVTSQGPHGILIKREAINNESEDSLLLSPEESRRNYNGEACMMMAHGGKIHEAPLILHVHEEEDEEQNRVVISKQSYKDDNDSSDEGLISYRSSDWEQLGDQNNSSSVSNSELNPPHSSTTTVTTSSMEHSNNNDKSTNSGSNCGSNLGGEPNRAKLPITKCGAYHSSHRDNIRAESSHPDIKCETELLLGPDIDTRELRESIGSTQHVPNMPDMPNLMPNMAMPMPMAMMPKTRSRKRGRTSSTRNSEDLENQRMTHIAVERNRRKQMNDHLNILRSLMPSSYIQRGDQASIIGGAIEFVKELEQILSSLKVQKERNEFRDSTSLHQGVSKELACESSNMDCTVTSNSCEMDSNVEVNLVGRVAIVKVLAQRKPHQLLNVLSMIESLHMKIMQVNITTIEDSILYYLNVEVEESSHLTLSAINIAKSIESLFRLF